MFEGWNEPNTWLNLAVLTLLEVILGIDNVVFISILVSQLPENIRGRWAKIGISSGVALRVALLSLLSLLLGLERPLFHLFEHPLSVRDLFLIGGGFFLLAKATLEIHSKVEGGREKESPQLTLSVSSGFLILQLLFINLVFSMDSILTAIGMVPAKMVWVMVTAVFLSSGMTLFIAEWVINFIENHPSLKILALSFLVLLGAVLIAEGLGHPIPKGYVYFPLAFSLTVEGLSIRYRRNLQIQKEKSHGS
ncbi:MAG: TerC family protein [Sandaracinaceae bacterium]|nr:TerC family protein [Sandaracinaceae bacterium]